MAHFLYKYKVSPVGETQVQTGGVGTKIPDLHAH